LLSCQLLVKTLLTAGKNFCFCYYPRVETQGYYITGCQPCMRTRTFSLPSLRSIVVCLPGSGNVLIAVLPATPKVHRRYSSVFKSLVVYCSVDRWSSN